MLEDGRPWTGAERDSADTHCAALAAPGIRNGRHRPSPAASTGLAAKFNLIKCWLPAAVNVLWRTASGRPGRVPRSPLCSALLRNAQQGDPFSGLCGRRGKEGKKKSQGRSLYQDSSSDLGNAPLLKRFVYEKHARQILRVVVINVEVRIAMRERNGGKQSTNFDREVGRKNFPGYQGGFQCLARTTE